METDEIEFILHCPICMDEFDDPRILPCQHSFCEPCLTSFIKDRNRNIRSKTFPCPVCRRKTKLRNDTDDASAFDRDLTKLVLLESKHILLEREEETSVASNTCGTETMTTDMFAFVSAEKDLQPKPENKKGLDMSTNGEIKSATKCTRPEKHPGRKNVKERTKRFKTSKIKNKPAKKSGQGNKRMKQKPELSEEINRKAYADLEFQDYFVVKFVLIPLYRKSWKNKSKLLGTLLATFLFLVYIICTYMAPAISVFTSCFMIIAVWKDDRKILLIYCFSDEKKVRQTDVFFFIVLQFSIVCLIMIIFQFVIVSSTACKNTLTNAMWRNDSVVSIHEFERHFLLSSSYWLNYIEIINTNLYYMIKQAVHAFLF